MMPYKTLTERGLEIENLWNYIRSGKAASSYTIQSYADFEKVFTAAVAAVVKNLKK